MKYLIETTKELLKIDSPSGYTKEAINFVEKEVTKLGFKTVKTKKGNLEVFIDFNKDYTVGLSAHLDTLGFIVRSINSDGTLRLSPIGGPILSTVNGAYCNIHTREEKVYTGTILKKERAIHVHENASKNVELNDLIVRIDEKVSSKEDVLKLGINNGDFVCYDPKVSYENGFLKSRFLDDKICVGILLDFLKDIQGGLELNYNIVIVFSTYEEVGHGGCHIHHKIDEMIALDMGCIGDDLAGNEYSVSICAKDSSGPYDYDLTTKLIQIAKSADIKYVVDIYPRYSSDASMTLRAGHDIRAALIGPGIDASHGMERGHIDGFIATKELLIKYLTF